MEFLKKLWSEWKESAKIFAIGSVCILSLLAPLGVLLASLHYENYWLLLLLIPLSFGPALINTVMGWSFE